MHEREIEGKMKKNRGLNDKKAYEDQFMAFCQFIFGALFYSLILSYSYTLREFLKNSWSTLAYIGFRERRKRKAGECNGTHGSADTARFLVGIKLHI